MTRRLSKLCFDGQQESQCSADPEPVTVDSEIETVDSETVTVEFEIV